MSKKRINGSIKSMTGYARGALNKHGLTLDLEIKTLNSRYLDFNFKLPREYAAFENRLREFVAQSVQRGRIELSLTRSSAAALAQTVSYNRAVFEQAFKSGCELLAGVGLEGADSRAALARDLMQRREIMEFADAAIDGATEWLVVQELCAQTLSQLSAMRGQEGAKLGADIASRLVELSAIREKILRSAESGTEATKRRLNERINRISPEVKIDPLRLASEAAILAERCDFTEELTRLGVHLEQFELVLSAHVSGRKLDFLLQEIGREFNTIASKCQDAAIQGLVIEAKSVAEKIREQVQNVE